MARRNCDEYDAWRDEFHVPTVKRKDPVEYVERISRPLEDGESNPRPVKCECGVCRTCLMTEW